ncbi:transmembrane and death domain protein 1 isoform X3 [Narcine bancroftii]|uniref:transmembrane and death domain protein 1 isoform X3 n=1 Tax=Narcine bancroftii TaxID=1343680 RepID=UPI0038310EFE
MYKMKLARTLVVLVFCIRTCSAEDTAADDIGIHQMSRIADLLTSVECDTLHTQLTHPEKDAMEEIHNMLEENDNLFKTRKRREIKLRKNMNQDKTLEVNKNVEEYGKTLEHAHSSLVVTDDEIKFKDGNRGKRSEDLEINWDELELIVEKEKLPPYPKKLTEGLRTVLWGVMFGFVGSILLGTISLYFIIRITEKDCLAITHRSSPPRHIARRGKPVKHIVYSSDDERVDVSKRSEHLKYYLSPFRPVNHNQEMSK